MLALVGEKASADRPTPGIDDAQSLFRRGVFALERERPREALTLLRLASELNPDSAAVLLALGVAAMRSLAIPEALRAFENAIALEPANFFAHFRMAELYLRIGAPTKAREEFARAMDFAENAEQRKMLRELMMLDSRRDARRVWRPDFSRERKRVSDR